MKKNLLFVTLIFMISQKSVGQQIYCDFEGIKVFNFGMSTGIMDSLVVNPALNNVDSSMHCAKYIRDTTLYDNIKLYTYAKIVDITPYANSSGGAPKIKMKLYSSAPVGTIVRLQLGIKSNDTYPAGVHSEYTATTTVQNAWQNITFNYSESPTGSLVMATDIDKVVILFHPNSSSRDTIYFDDLVGPELINLTGIPDHNTSSSFKLNQNSPNPSKDNTHINFQLSAPGLVSLQLYDVLGNLVSSILDQNMKAGTYSIPFETAAIPNGIYFYVLKKEGDSRSIKMIVSK